MTASVETVETSGGADPAVRWRIPSDEVLDWHDWGDELVVRAASCAQTHLLSPIAGSVLLALLDTRSSLNIDSLFAHAVGDAQAGSRIAMSAAERESLRAILAELERSGLVTQRAA